MCNSFPIDLLFRGVQRCQRLKHRWEPLPLTHKIAFTGEVLHIYGRVAWLCRKKALHHCGNYCITFVQIVKLISKKLPNLFVTIAKCVNPNGKIYFSTSWNIFGQITKCGWCWWPCSPFEPLRPSSLWWSLPCWWCSWFQGWDLMTALVYISRLCIRSIKIWYNDKQTFFHQCKICFVSRQYNKYAKEIQDSCILFEARRRRLFEANDAVSGGVTLSILRGRMPVWIRPRCCCWVTVQHISLSPCHMMMVWRKRYMMMKLWQHDANVLT